MARVTRLKSASRRASRTTARAASVSRRTQVVWMALVASMTLVGGGLWLASGGSLANAQGVTPLVATATTGGSELEAILRMPAPIDARRWRAIVIHHSGDSTGTPTTLDAKAKAMGLRGLGYHFVIGNGNGMDDGEISVSGRWQNQLPGAHAAGKDADWFNRQSIGICLVGDGDSERFSATQVRRVCQLVEFLSKKFDIPQERIYLHSQLAPTSSPGRFFPESTLRAQIGQR